MLCQEPRYFPIYAIVIKVINFSRHSSRSKTPSAATTPTGASNTRAQHRAALAAQQQAAKAAAAAEQQQQQQQQQQPQPQATAKHAGFCELCEHHFDNLSVHLASTEHAVAVGLKDWSVLDKALELVNV